MPISTCNLCMLEMRRHTVAIEAVLKSFPCVAYFPQTMRNDRQTKADGLDHSHMRRLSVPTWTSTVRVSDLIIGSKINFKASGYAHLDSESGFVDTTHQL